jgi:hypothetical protein
MKTEASEALRTVTGRSRAEATDWLKNYLRGNGFYQEPKFEVPYDPDRSPGLYLLETLRQLFETNEKEYLRISVVFADAAVTLIEQLLSSKDQLNDSDGAYVTDLSWILWDLTPTDPKIAVRTLTMVKNDPKFEIEERGSSIRTDILRALLEQILRLPENEQDKRLLKTIHEELTP